MSSNALGVSSFQWPEPRQGEGWRRAASQMLSPRAAAVEARLNALRTDAAARAQLEVRVADIQRDRAAKVRWTPIELGPAKPSQPAVATLRAAAAASPRHRSQTGHAYEDAASSDPVGGWEQLRNPNPPPPLRFGFESEGARRRDYAARTMTPLAASAGQEPSLLAAADRRTAPEVELVHSALTSTLRPSSRRSERAGLAWRPASRQSAWAPFTVGPSPITIDTGPVAPDESAASARATSRASQRLSPRMGDLQKAAQQHTSRIMSINTAHKLASARPLTPAQLRKYRIDDLDRMSLSRNEFRAQRAVLSGRLVSEVGVKRYLQPQVARTHRPR